MLFTIPAQTGGEGVAWGEYIRGWESRGHLGILPSPHAHPEMAWILHMGLLSFFWRKQGPISFHWLQPRKGFPLQGGGAVLRVRLGSCPSVSPTCSFGFQGSRGPSLCRLELMRLTVGLLREHQSWKLPWVSSSAAPPGRIRMCLKHRLTGETDLVGPLWVRFCCCC